MSKHSDIRSRQRSLPPFVSEVLDRFGREEYDGHGGVLLYLNKKSRRQMEQEWGRDAVRICKQWMDAYKVVDVTNGETITTGHRTKRINRR